MALLEMWFHEWGNPSNPLHHRLSCNGGLMLALWLTTGVLTQQGTPINPEPPEPPPVAVDPLTSSGWFELPSRSYDRELLERAAMLTRSNNEAILVAIL